MRNHPKDEGMGSREVPMGGVVYIEASDFKESRLNRSSRCYRCSRFYWSSRR